ncbi:MAG: hypothetical protein M1829_004366 [Trizodia sp. TS-e1964]|nr:MAG: hypothetical protein M1829_004366 [Trizodia sp. TS-e1964]
MGASAVAVASNVVGFDGLEVLELVVVLVMAVVVELLEVDGGGTRVGTERDELELELELELVLVLVLVLELELEEDVGVEEDELDEVELDAFGMLAELAAEGPGTPAKALELDCKDKGPHPTSPSPVSFTEWQEAVKAQQLLGRIIMAQFVVPPGH